MALSLTAAAASIVVGCATGTSSDDADTPGAPDATADRATSDSAARPNAEFNDASGGEPDSDGEAQPAPYDAAVPDAGVHDAGDGAVSSGDASDGSAATDDAGDDASFDGGDASDDGDASFDGGDASDDGGEPVDGGTPKPAQGEVVISEVMFDPSGAEPDTEWIEIYNAASSPRLLSGLALKDGSDRMHTIRAGLIVAANSYVVLASMKPSVVATGIADAVVVYDYNTGQSPQIQLANGSGGGVVLVDGATVIARANYGALGLSGSGNGHSIQLKTLDYASAGVKANWCKSAHAWATGSDDGTPGAPNDCP